MNKLSHSFHSQRYLNGTVLLCPINSANHAHSHSVTRKMPFDNSDDELQAALNKKRQTERQQQADLGAPTSPETPSAEAIWGQVKQVQKSSLDATARALATAKGTEAVGVASLAQLKAQGEQLERIHNRAVDAEEHAAHASETADTLNAYTKLVPVQMQVKLSRRPVGQRIASVGEAKEQLAGLSQKAGTKFAHSGPFEDETEGKIAKNLDDISATLNSLGNIAEGMASEVAKQDEVLDATARVVDSTARGVAEAHSKTKKFLDS
jgi:hypothetical protein